MRRKENILLLLSKRIEFTWVNKFNCKGCRKQSGIFLAVNQQNSLLYIGLIVLNLGFIFRIK